MSAPGEYPDTEACVPRKPAPVGKRVIEWPALQSGPGTYGPWPNKPPEPENNQEESK